MSNNFFVPFPGASHCCRSDAVICTNTLRLNVDHVVERTAYKEVGKHGNMRSIYRWLSAKIVSLALEWRHNGHDGISNHQHLDCYASAFRRRRHYVFGLSVRPSVRSLKYPLSTCTWVRWSTRPTVTVLRHVRPSVRRGFRAFAGELMEGMAWNFTCWCILTTFRTD